MARIPILQDSDPGLTEEQRAFLTDAGKARGRLLNIYRAMANRPSAGRPSRRWCARSIARSRRSAPSTASSPT